MVASRYEMVQFQIFPRKKAIKETSRVNKVFVNKFWLLFNCSQPLKPKMFQKQQKCVYNHRLCN